MALIWVWACALSGDIQKEEESFEDGHKVSFPMDATPFGGTRQIHPVQSEAPIPLTEGHFCVIEFKPST